MEEQSSMTADQILDELLPDNFDWRDMVGSYPLTAVSLAAVGGFLLGRKHGTVLVAAVSAFMVREVTRNINTFLGEEVLDE